VIPDEVAVTRKPIALLACGLCCSLLPLLAMAKGMGTRMPLPPGDSPLIVITGASYAKSWGTPPLPGYARVINRGVGGDRTDEVLQRFSGDVVALAPDAVLIWGHVNNITRAKASERPAAKRAAREHYEAMLRLARTAGIEVILATEVPWTEGQGLVAALRRALVQMRGKSTYASLVTADVRELNEFVRQLAAREGCRLLDFERVFALPDGTRRPEFTAEDGSHISRAGYDALTAYAIRALREAS